ncbi:transposase [Mesorhizobium sp. LNJC394B00]|nr:transposase [Mesorhizobium sp. LNJC394B00]
MIPAGVKVLVASHPVDFRKGPDGLLALVRDAGSDPFLCVGRDYVAEPP